MKTNSNENKRFVFMLKFLNINNLIAQPSDDLSNGNNTITL